MTLRERIESYVESLGGEMDGFELSQDGLRAVLDAVLTETVIADAERDEYAEIGRLVMSLQDKVEIFSHYGGAFMVEPLRPDESPHKTRTLLAALKSLKERCG